MFHIFSNNTSFIFFNSNTIFLFNSHFEAASIAFSNKSELVSVIKDMLLKNELDISFAQDFVDLDKVREEMIMYSTPLDMYNEYDKLEDELSYCLDKFFKYNNDELFNVLVNDKDFKFVENIGLVR